MKPNKPFKRPAAKAKPAMLSFAALVDSIRQVHEHCAAQVNRVVNVSLTLRNWAIGWYIREYEQKGSDRAKYGEGLLDALSGELDAHGMKDLSSRTLRQCRQFYSVYSAIWQTVSAKSLERLLPPPIWGSLTAKSIWQTLSAKSSEEASKSIREAVTPVLGAPAEKLLTVLSFSHLAEKTVRWSSMPWRAWITECSSRNTNWNFPTGRSCSASSNPNAAKWSDDP